MHDGWVELVALGFSGAVMGILAYAGWDTRREGVRQQAAEDRALREEAVAAWLVCPACQALAPADPDEPFRTLPDPLPQCEPCRKRGPRRTRLSYHLG